MIEIITELQNSPAVKWIFVSRENAKIIEEHPYSEEEVKLKRLKLVAAEEKSMFQEEEQKIIFYNQDFKKLI